MQTAETGYLYILKSLKQAEQALCHYFKTFDYYLFVCFVLFQNYILVGIMVDF